MLIKVNVNDMQIMSRYCFSAVAHIESASSLLKQIPRHNDWNCREKKIIEDEIAGIVSRDKLLNERITDYASNIDQVKNRYISLANNSEQEFINIFDVIARAKAIPVRTSVGSGSVTATIANNRYRPTVILPPNVWNFSDVTHMVKGD